MTKGVGPGSSSVQEHLPSMSGPGLRTGGSEEKKGGMT